MFRYFWMEGKDIPAGVGFGHFTAKHILMLLLCAVFITALTLWFKKQLLRRQNTFLKILACLMLAGNLVRDLFLLIIGRMSLAYLPLHLCSFSIFVYLLHAFLPESYNDTVMTLNPANGRYFAVRDPNTANRPASISPRFAKRSARSALSCCCRVRSARSCFPTGAVILF